MRFVLATAGSHGDVNPFLAVARALSARGHEVAVATHAYYRALVEDVGVGFHPLRPDFEPAWGRRVMHPHRGARVLLRDIFGARVRESYHDLRAAARGADLLLSHPLMFAAPLVAEATGVRWASAVLAPAGFLSLGADAPLVAPELAGVRRRAPAVYRAILRGGKRVMRGWLAPVDALRRELGLPPAGHPAFEGQHAPGLVLALFSPLLATPQPDWPPQTLVTGAVVDAAVHDAMTSGVPHALARFLDAGAPPLVLTLGTSAVLTGGAPRIYAEGAAAAAALGRRAVLLTGHDPRNVPPRLPRDVLAVPFASHAALFPRAAAVVHQGGMGTLAQALRAGRPMLVAPFAYDQPDNADRAARLGVARIVPPRRWRADRVAEALHALLADASMVARAKDVGTAVRAEDGAAVAAAALAQLARHASAAGAS